MIHQIINKFRYIPLLFILVLLIANICLLANLYPLNHIFGIIIVFIPGTIITIALNLEDSNLLEKILIAVGLSIFLVIILGLFINQLFPLFGYNRPLTFPIFLISINLLSIISLTFLRLFRKNLNLQTPDLKFNNHEKIFLIFLIQFPFLSIFGVKFVEYSGNNIILMFFLLLIPTYIILVSFYNKKLGNRFFAISTLIISLSLLLMFMFRFSHIYGNDVQIEYNYFQMTLNGLKWEVFGSTPLDASLGISLLPTIFAVLTKLNAQEYLFKFIFVSVCSLIPLAVYSITKRYTSNFLSFLASCFFMFQMNFINTAGNSRTNLAVFFVALVIMVLVNGNMKQWKKSLLLILFLFSVILIHYSTMYIFLMMMFLSWIFIHVYIQNNDYKKNITIGLIALLFVTMFFWYAITTETLFRITVNNLKDLFFSLTMSSSVDLKSDQISLLFAQTPITTVLGYINFIITWSTFSLIAIGFLNVIKKSINMSLFKLKTKFISKKFSIEFISMSIASIIILCLMIALPYLSVSYDIYRVYLVVTIILSFYFVRGGTFLAGKLKIRNNYVMVLLILVPYFLFSTGSIYTLAGVPNSLLFTSGGERSNLNEINDPESFSIKWFGVHGSFFEKEIHVTDTVSRGKILSQSDGKIHIMKINSYYFTNSTYKVKNGYLYLSSYNVIDQKYNVKKNAYNMSDLNFRFKNQDKIYDGGYSEIWWLKKISFSSQNS